MVSWDSWTPADHTAAEAIAGPRLQELLDAAGIELPMAKSRIGELAAILQATVTSDVRAREMGSPVPVTNSQQSLARQLETLLDDPADAAPLAHTLMALAFIDGRPWIPRGGRQRFARDDFDAPWPRTIMWPSPAWCSAGQSEPGTAPGGKAEVPAHCAG